MADYIDRQIAIDAVGLNTWAGARISRLPSAEPTLYGYNIKHLCFIATLLQKENIPPKELKAMLSDIERMTHIIVDDITDTIQREIERSLSWK